MNLIYKLKKIFRLKCKKYKFQLNLFCLHINAFFKIERKTISIYNLHF